ncbi:sulfotransferase family 2 domain-containing protein [Rhabdochromatium marinum]|uniref:sulfotransferase family 2 domain-containing protein n=1 Tax=Rhabdochromatium marinum TaxID=48729 RepID=UPI0019082E36|nr:sulfotransferase family 2 domain-containing protein [Rhabdochromatium marinum]
MPIFSINNKRVFFYHIPKTGGSSLEFTMSALGVTVELWSIKLHKNKAAGFPCSPQHWHQAIITEIFSDFEHEFAVIRHPVERMVSEYKHRARLAMKKNQPQQPFADWVDIALKRQGKNPYIFDNHLRPQVEFIGEATELFKLEDGLDKPMAYACDCLGIEKPAGIPALLRGQTVSVDLDDDVLDKICQFYRADFDAFGYDQATVSAPTRE